MSKKQTLRERIEEVIWEAVDEGMRIGSVRSAKFRGVAEVMDYDYEADAKAEETRLVNKIMEIIAPKEKEEVGE